jgi:thiol-disulfide isomerase/thioredoxin/YHS domain-containing protein
MMDSFRGYGWAAVVWLISSTLSAEQTLPWETTLENAQRQAAQTQRLVYAHFWAPWCGPCRRMESEVFQQPAVAGQVGANYVPVKINADQFPELARRYGIVGLPTEVILTPQGQLVNAFNWRGQRLNAATFVARLNETAAAYRQQTGASIAKIQNGVPAGNGSPAPASAESIAAAPPAVASLIPSPTDSGPSFAAPSPAYGHQAGTASSTNNLTGQGPVLNAPRTGISSGGSILPPGAASAAPPSIVPVNPSTGATLPGLAGQQISPRPPAANSPAMNSIPPGNPPLDLDGFCPVTLLEKKQWVHGDMRYGARHRGRTYLFIGPDEKRRFFADPNRFAPVNSGYDVVLDLEQKKTVPGLRQYGVTYAGHVFLFADQTTRDRFEKNPPYYAKQALDQLRANSSPNVPPVR